MGKKTSKKKTAKLNKNKSFAEHTLSTVSSPAALLNPELVRRELIPVPEDNTQKKV